jgi:DNA repair ATPase RecN
VQHNENSRANVTRAVAAAVISELKIRNFKSLESVDLRLGNLNLLVGANASGKSNFLDSLRFLQGLANGLSLKEVLNGKPQTSTSVKWDGIRGGSELVAFRARDGVASPTLSFEVKQLTSSGDSGCTYTLEAAPSSGNLIRETIEIEGGAHWSGMGDSTIPSSKDVDPGDYDSSVIPRLIIWNEIRRTFLENQRLLADSSEKFSKIEQVPALANAQLQGLLENRKKAKEAFAQVHDNWLKLQHLISEVTSRFHMENLDPKDDETEKLAKEAGRIFSLIGDLQAIDPRPDLLKKYSKSSSMTRMDESGAGLAGLVHKINENPEAKGSLLEWLKELRPDEISDLITIKGAVDDFMIAIQEGTKQFPAEVLSDGTLRFIALTVAFFQPSMPKVLVIEDIEKGLHPSRLRLLLEMLRSQSRRTGTQVFATTHSPTLLNWLTEEDRKTTFVCSRDSESGATKMRSLTEVPRLEELIRKNYNLDQLFEEGWLESVLHES